MADFYKHRPFRWITKGFCLESAFGADHITHVDRKAFARAGFDIHQFEFKKDGDLYVEDQDWQEDDPFCDSILIGFNRKIPIVSIGEFYAFITIYLPSKDSGFDSKDNFEKISAKFHSSKQFEEMSPCDYMECRFQCFDNQDTVLEVDYRKLIEIFVENISCFCNLLFNIYGDTYWKLSTDYSEIDQVCLVKYPNFMNTPYPGNVHFSTTKIGEFSKEFSRYFQ